MLAGASISGQCTSTLAVERIRAKERGEGVRKNRSCVHADGAGISLLTMRQAKKSGQIYMQYLKWDRQFQLLRLTRRPINSLLYYKMSGGLFVTLQIDWDLIDWWNRFQLFYLFFSSVRASLIWQLAEESKKYTFNYGCLVDPKNQLDSLSHRKEKKWNEILLSKSRRKRVSKKNQRIKLDMVIAGVAGQLTPKLEDHRHAFFDSFPIKKNVKWWRRSKIKL